MHRSRREVPHTETGRHNEPTLSIASGEKVLVQTELCSGDWLQGPADTWSPEKGKGPNPSSGCVRVDGAGPGDMLAVTIESVEVIGAGYTGFGPGMNPFPDWIRGKEWGIVTRTVEIRDGFIERGGRGAHRRGHAPARSDDVAPNPYRHPRRHRGLRPPCRRRVPHRRTGVGAVDARLLRHG